MIKKTSWKDAWAVSRPNQSRCTSRCKRTTIWTWFKRTFLKETWNCASLKLQSRISTFSPSKTINKSTTAFSETRRNNWRALGMDIRALKGLSLWTTKMWAIRSHDQTKKSSWRATSYLKKRRCFWSGSKTTRCMSSRLINLNQRGGLPTANLLMM